MQDEETCTCDDSDEEHACPYQQDINNDSESMCTCCSYCEYQCAQDI